MSILIESNGNEKRAYDSIILEPKSLSILGSELGMRIIKELSENQGCALDLARKLEEHEQKIYYHLRKLEKSGIVKMVGSEKRFGMTAKIYGVVSPVVAAKLYEDGQELPVNRSIEKLETVKFLKPFIENGRLNAKIIMGSPHPHGKHEATARDAVHIADFMIFLGGFIDDIENVQCKVDTKITEQDLKENMIVFGGPKINMITQKLNEHLPIQFDEKNNFSIVSKISKKTYNYDTNALIIKMENPFNPKKKILVLAGIRSKGARTAVLAFIRNMEDITKGNLNDKKIIAKVLMGIDKNGDGNIDSVKFLE